jgi:hypothetical protein
MRTRKYLVVWVYITCEVQTRSAFIITLCSLTSSCFIVSEGGSKPFHFSFSCFIFVGGGPDSIIKIQLVNLLDWKSRISSCMYRDTRISSFLQNLDQLFSTSFIWFSRYPSCTVLLVLVFVMEFVTISKVK